MQKILSILVVMVFSGVTAQATIYSCRDNQGQLHLTDNLQSLPAECLGRTRTVQQKDAGNLSYVPAQKISPGSGADFQKTVRDATEEQQQRKEWLNNLSPRAEQLAAQYHQAVKLIHAEKRDWRYDSRGIIKKANERKQEALEGKQQLLTEMDRQKISRKDKGKIVSKLDEMKD